MKIEYNNLYTHFILVTKNRFPFITESNRERIEKYVTGIVNNSYSKMYAVYANPEHIHFLVSRSPRVSEQELLAKVAESTSRFIKENKLVPNNFEWQESASAFSVSKTDVDKVCRYILNQPAHHTKISFAQEYEKFLSHYQQTLKWGL